MARRLLDLDRKALLHNEKQNPGMVMKRGGSLDLDRPFDERRWSLDGRKSLDVRRNSSEYRYGAPLPSFPVCPCVSVSVCPCVSVSVCPCVFVSVSVCPCVSVAATVAQALTQDAQTRKPRVDGTVQTGAMLPCVLLMYRRPGALFHARQRRLSVAWHLAGGAMLRRANCQVLETAPHQSDFLVDGHTFGGQTNIISLYADPELEETWRKYGLRNAALVISCMNTRFKSNLRLCEFMADTRVPVVVVCDTKDEAAALYGAGCTYVQQPVKEPSRWPSPLCPHLLASSFPHARCCDASGARKVIEECRRVRGSRLPCSRSCSFAPAPFPGAEHSQRTPGDLSRGARRDQEHVCGPRS